ncbi:Arm DNA-binding domain-containing protein [Nostoc sp.]|uniref:Arm DNA-binding domain-containing protein n=1 Tax=Nostoc sp. TaxID=1180 RepID=UPI002FF5FD51
MESQKSQSIARRGSVQIKNSNGSLQLVFSHPIVTPTGELKTKRFYLSTRHYDTTLGRHQALTLAATIQRDIDYGEFDASLAKYKPAASLSTVAQLRPLSFS